jgi:DNA-binding transcriptional regulator YiaG
MTPAELKQRRERLGLTQVQLAALLDVQPTTVSRWETGSKIIGHRGMLDLALQALEYKHHQGAD